MNFRIKVSWIFNIIAAGIIWYIFNRFYVLFKMNITKFPDVTGNFLNTMDLVGNEISHFQFKFDIVGNSYLIGIVGIMLYGMIILYSKYSKKNYASR